MEDEIMELKEEIGFLSHRIEILEKTEKKRHAFFYVKILVKVILILLSVYGIWKGYEYLSKEIPSIMEEKIKEIKINNITN